MGQTHEATELPNLLLGHGGGALHPGSHIDFAGKPLSRLFLAMLASAGIEEKGFAGEKERLGV